MSEAIGAGECPPGANAWLARRLASPALTGPSRLLARHWRETVVDVTCALPTGCLPGLWLNYALRGAVGARLHGFPAPDGAEPSPFDALMRPVHLQIDKRHVPVPVVFDFSQERGRIVFHMRLLGFAGIWRRPATEAFVAALAAGMSIAENARISRPYEVLDICWSRQEGVRAEVVGNISKTVAVWPRSPLCYGAREHDPGKPERLVLAALGRIAGLARWQGVHLDCRLPTLRELASRLTIRFGAPVPVELVRKRSRRHPGHAAPLRGERTKLLISGLTLDEKRLLVLAGRVGAGGHTSWGFGRFQVVTT